VRVWDTGTATSAVRASCCVGMTSVPGTPVNMKCHESLLYVAAGSSVTAIDLRTMQKVVTAAVHQPKLYSFDAVPSKYLVCTGGDGRYDQLLFWEKKLCCCCQSSKLVNHSCLFNCFYSVKIMVKHHVIF